MKKLAMLLLLGFLFACGGSGEQNTTEEVSEEMIKETQEVEQTTQELNETTNELEEKTKQTESEVDSLLQDI